MSRQVLLLEEFTKGEGWKPAGGAELGGQLGLKHLWKFPTDLGTGTAVWGGD